MKKLFLITIFNLVCWNIIAQQNVEFKFEKGTSFLKYSEKNPGLNYLQLNNAIEKNKSIIIFSGFDKKDSIKVIQKNNVIIEKNLSYSAQTGISEIITIENTESLRIKFLKLEPIEIFLDNKYLKKYKHIYIVRRDGKYLVKYSNRLKKIM